MGRRLPSQEIAVHGLINAGAAPISAGMAIPVQGDEGAVEQDFVQTDSPLVRRRRIAGGTDNQEWVTG